MRAGVTVLRLMPNQDLRLPDTHVIHVFDCRMSLLATCPSMAPTSHWRT